MSSTIKSYFERKRRDLSDKPNNQREKKNQRESCVDLLLNKETNDDTHGFTGGIGSPRFASIIYDCLELQFGVQKLFFSKKKIGVKSQ